MTVAQPDVAPSSTVRPATAAGDRPAADRGRAPLSVTLRERTRDLHTAAEAVFDLERRLVDRGTYAALLMLLRNFYGPAEDALATVAGWERLRPAIDVGVRRRAALLDDDLAQLGIAATTVARTPRTSLRLHDLAEGLGCLYVLEGSALGGRVIAQRAQLVLGPELPVTFFAGAGRAAPGRAWRELQAALNAFAADGTAAGDGRDREDRVVAAARRTFAAFTECISGTEAGR
jgi:heme oxygenase